MSSPRLFLVLVLLGAVCVLAPSALLLPAAVMAAEPQPAGEQSRDGGTGEPRERELRHPCEYIEQCVIPCEKDDPRDCCRGRWKCPPPEGNIPVSSR